MIEMGRVLDIFDESLDGFVHAEWIVIGTVFFIGTGLSILGMSLDTMGWEVRIPLIVGGLGAILISVRAIYEMQWA